MYLQHPHGYRVEINELTEVCKLCEGKGKGPDGAGSCPNCKGLGCVLSDGVSGFIIALLQDDEVFWKVLEFVQRLNAELQR
jgi:hypothetical protein